MYWRNKALLHYIKQISNVQETKIDYTTQIARMYNKQSLITLYKKLECIINKAQVHLTQKTKWKQTNPNETCKRVCELLWDKIR